MKSQNKNYKINQSNQKKSQKKLLIISLLVGLIIIVLVGFFAYQSSNDDTGLDSDAKTTSSAETAQSSFSDGNERPIQEANQDKGEAVITDNSGSIAEVPDESTWVSSSTGQITLYSPSENQLIINGNEISGESSLSSVNFRIIDDISGVISTGQISVVNGKFSGNMQFSTSASSGRLDIYATRDDGSEFSNIEVPVLFK